MKFARTEQQRAERRAAAPKSARVPAGDRTTYSSVEGLS
jgi:hypothetical protein